MCDPPPLYGGVVAVTGARFEVKVSPHDESTASPRIFVIEDRFQTVCIHFFRNDLSRYEMTIIFLNLAAANSSSTQSHVDQTQTEMRTCVQRVLHGSAPLYTGGVVACM